jgi:F-type H+-transporting ATPase subunit delta
MAENRGIARPYAQAAFELARDGGQLAGWSDALHAAALAVSNCDLARLIDAPGTDSGAVTELIIDVCRKFSGETPADATQLANLLKLLTDNRRLRVLPDIAELFDKLKTDVENSVNVVLTAASPVDDTQQNKIAAALKTRFGREVNLHFKLDENLIGGARLQADDLIIDGTVRTGLEKLASTLVN